MSSGKHPAANEAAALNVLKAGEFFGESVLSRSATRVATVSAARKSTLFRLPRKVIMSIFGDDLQASKGTLTCMPITSSSVWLAIPRPVPPRV